MSCRGRSAARVALALALALALAGSSGCARETPRTVEVGHHRVRLVPPRGWEHLDHGRQQLFRLGESELSLVDLGPATREGMVRELRAAERLWRSGHRRDAFQRVRELHAPALHYASSDQRAEFWRPWNDVTYIPEVADSLAIGPAFEALVSGARGLPEASSGQLLEYVLATMANPIRQEVERSERRTIHGSEWLDIATWNRVSHLERSRVAFVVDRGYLLVLGVDRGPFKQMEPAFEALLASCELVADETRGPKAP